MSAAVKSASQQALETEADKRLYVEIGLVPVTCQTCGVEVSVKKNSQKHTSVQWTADAVAGCEELGAVDPASSALRLGCTKLKASIDAAVRDGAVVVPDA